MTEEKTFFEKIREKKVFVCLSQVETDKKKMVVMSHGFRGSSIGPARNFVDFQRFLNENGYSVLRFDQPNSGNSDGDYVDSSFNEWVDTTTYFAKKYLDLGYKVGLLGQSMGASTTVVASARPEIAGKIDCMLLWVPDPETDFEGIIDEIGEEGGQRYRNEFWKEAMDADFFGCLDKFNGKIHLVYGEKDRYVSLKLRKETIKLIQEKGQTVKILKGQDHSPWDYDLTWEVYKEELEVLKKSV